MLQFVLTAYVSFTRYTVLRINVTSVAIQNLAAGKQPACVEACPTKALTFGDMNDPSSAVSRKVKENPVYRTKVELGTQPNLYHIPFQHGEPRR